MRKLSKQFIRLLSGLIVVALVAGVGIYYLVSRGSNRTVTAQFSSAVGVYPGTPVDILGIAVGKVISVKPVGASVAIKMQYDGKYRLASNAVSVIVANSLVSDRYIQLQPVYTGKDTSKELANHADIPNNRTASPAELDDIYAALNKLSTALGPSGANKSGALSTFVNVAAANLQGNGAALGNSITQLSKAAKTLSNGREDLFGTVKNLQAFTKALSDSDVQVRHFEQQLAQVASDLASERADLGTALHTLSGALNSVAKFVHDNASKVHTDVTGLETITGLLVKQKASLNETLAVAPVALANIVHAYQPNIGVLADRSNLSSLLDPASICDLVNSVVQTVTTKAGLAQLIGKNGLLGRLLGTVTSAVVSGCKTVVDPKNNPVSPGQAQALISDLLGDVGGLIGVGNP